MARVVPRATYRVQLRPEFGFDGVAALADYLAALGVSHLYASPYLQAAPGSTHGYDVVAHDRPNVELGGEDGHRRMCDALGRAGLGQVLDVVPNHMAITGRDNQWWWDVLENGPSSRYASYFDVDWNPPEAKLRNTVLMPVLGDHYGRVLENGELRLERDGGSFLVRYHEQAFPVAPPSIDALLRSAAAIAESPELESIGAWLGRLPPSWLTDRESVRERHRDKEVLRARLEELVHDPAIAAAIDTMVERVNADHDALDALLDRQNFRLAFWRTAGRELDYRRFFDINTLVGLRVEDDVVFADTHWRVARWVREGVVDGLRIDHPDGLRDPAGYFAALAEATDRAWVVAEKILERGERLPGTWAVDGTTGYDFLNLAGGLFVDPAGEQPLTALYAELTGAPTDYPAVVLDNKLRITREVLAADVSRLTQLFMNVCEAHRRYRDYTRHELTDVLREVLASFPVYRTYVAAPGGTPSPDDVAHVQGAIAAARERRADLDPALFGFLEDLLLLRIRGDQEAELVMRFQQVTGPVMAKGVEDTTFYTFNRFVALNEVGGDPSHFGVAVEEFHAACGRAQGEWPASMLASSTHDTKRSEDVRARLAVLSELPGEWGAAVRRWTAHNARHKKDAWPDANTEYLLYQTLVGAWPLSVDRAVAYMEKATKEAKAHTSWTDPNPDYDEAVRSFVTAVLADVDFVDDLARFAGGLVGPGRVNSLAATLLKLTAPGVPDIYQGTELWDLSLVDPDNRRPADFDLRRRLLASLDELDAEGILARMDDGLPKLHVIRAALRLRAEQPAVFAAGGYQPLAAAGPMAEHVVAFARGGEVATVVPRLVVSLGGDWADTTLDLPAGRWGDVLTGDVHDGGHVPLAALLGRFPVALLAKE